MSGYQTQVGFWKDLPEGTMSDGPLFVIPDVHGNAAILEHLLGSFKKSVDTSEYTVVFLGDLIDRGPENLRAIELSREAKNDFGGHVILPGNHELMMLDGMTNMLSLQLWYANGGDAVIDECPGTANSKPSELRDRLKDTLPAGYLEDIKNSSGHFQSGNIICVHGGLCPMTRDDWKTQRDEFLAQGHTDISDEHWAWIRKPFLEWRGGWDPERRDVVVHGHTVMCRGPLDFVSDVEGCSDALEEARRFSLDIGAPFFDQITGLEIRDGQYRFHFVRK